MANNQPAADPLDAYMGAAKAKVDPAYEGLAAATTQNAQNVAGTNYALEKQTLNREPLVRETYKNLFDELNVTETENLDVAKQVGGQRIGTAKSGQADAGISANAGGAFRAPVTNEEEGLKQSITKITDKYKVDSNKLTIEQNSAVQDILDKAQNYHLAGDSAMSQALVDLAKIKLDQQQAAITQASKMFGEDLATKRLDLSIAAQDRSTAASERATRTQQIAMGVLAGRSVNKAGGYDYTNKAGQPTNVATFAKEQGISVAQALEGSSDPGDQIAAKRYEALQQEIAAGNMTAAQAAQAFGSSYGHMGKVTFQEDNAI